MKRFFSQDEEPDDANFTSLPLNYMTKRLGEVSFGEGGTKVFILQPVIENEEPCKDENGNNVDANNKNDEEAIQERMFNKMRNFTQENWHQLHKQFLLTNAFSEDGQKHVLDYFFVGNYFQNYMDEESEPSESFKYMSML